MSTYLHALVAECDAISDEGVAGQLTKLSSPEESETVLGRASSEILRLYALFSQTFEAVNAKADEFNDAQLADERDANLLEKLHDEHTTLDKKLKTLKFALWQTVGAKYPLPEDASGYGIRAEGDIVAIPKQSCGGMRIIAIDMSGLFGGGGSDDGPGGLLERLFGRSRRH